MFIENEFVFKNISVFSDETKLVAEDTSGKRVLLLDLVDSKEEPTLQDEGLRESLGYTASQRLN